MTNKVFVVGTTNQDKLEAVKNATKTDMVFGMKDVSSGVSEQPFGESETTLGAINRNLLCKNYMMNMSLNNIVCIGIESGIIKNTNYEEVTYMCVGFTNKNNEFVYRILKTDNIIINPQYNFLVEKALKTKDVTFGSLIEKYNNWPNGSWQSRLCGISRKDLITMTLAPFFEELYKI